MVDEDQDLEDQIRDHAGALAAGEPITPDQARAHAIAVWNRHRRRRHLMVAAAVLIFLAAAGLFVRTSLADDTPVTAGRPTPRDLWELADRVAGLPPTTVLDEDDGARYTYRRGARSTDRPTSEVTSDIEEMWVSIDGAGRQVTVAEDNPTQTSEGVASPDLFTVDGVPVRTFLQLPDDADAVAAAFITYGKRGFTDEVSPMLVDALSYTGLPGPARAGALRALDLLGMVPVPDADPGPHLLRVAGPRGPDGSKLQADFDVRTGMAVAWELYGAGGEVTRFVTIEVDLRRDSQRRP
ncbi:MAG TPA: hypothetical protein VF728_01730 [Nocardioides sp.]